MSTLTDKRIDDLILWHRNQAAENFSIYSDLNLYFSFKKQVHKRISDYHRDTAEALAELAQFRHEEEMEEED